jgi:hypothetical protein
VRLNPQRVHLVERGFGRRAERHFSGEFFLTHVRNPKHFRREPFDVFRFFKEVLFGNDDGKLHRLVAVVLKFALEQAVQLAYQDGRPGFVDDEALHVVPRVDEVRGVNDLVVPLGEVLALFGLELAGGQHGRHKKTGQRPYLTWS